MKCPMCGIEPAESLERLRHLERIAGENYADLLDQMDEAWGRWPDAGAAPEVGRVEINAFLESRIVHKPATRLRERLWRLEAVVTAAQAMIGVPLEDAQDLARQRCLTDALSALDTEVVKQ